MQLPYNTKTIWWTMRRKLYLDCSLVLVTCFLFLAPKSGSANNLEIHGCWERVHSIILFADGHTEKSKVSCVDFYDTEKMTKVSACPPAFKQVTAQISVNDLTNLVVKNEYSTEKYSFQRTGDTLVLDNYGVQTPSANRTPDKTMTKVSIVMKYKDVPSQETCFPPQVIVTKDDVFRHYRILDLVVSSIENTIRMEVLMSLTKHFDRGISAQALGDDGVRRMLEHVDRISWIAAKGVRPRYEAQTSRIKDIFFAPGHYGDHVSPDLADKNVQDWLVGAMDEVLQARMVSSYLMAGFPKIGPLDLKNLVPSDGFNEKLSRERETLAKEYGLGEEFLRDRLMLMQVADIPRLRNLLPNGNRLSELKSLSLRSAEMARKNRYWLSSARGVARAEMFTSQALWSQDRKEVISDDVANKMKDEVELLATRIGMVSSLAWDETGDKSRCLSSGIDLKSVEDGKGDWTKIRLANGSGIAQGSMEHMRVVDVIERGCAGTKNLKTARKVLEDVVATPNLQPKFAAECKLAHWFRYGIGGEKDIRRADELEAAYINRSDTKCRSQHPIDPSNPWADLK